MAPNGVEYPNVPAWDPRVITWMTMVPFTTGGFVGGGSGGLVGGGSGGLVGGVVGEGGFDGLEGRLVDPPPVLPLFARPGAEVGTVVASVVGRRAGAVVVVVVVVVGSVGRSLAQASRRLRSAPSGATLIA